MRVVLRALSAGVAAALALAACGGNVTSGGLPFAFAQAKKHSGSGSGYIKHVVIVIQENRSFDNFFSTFPGADGTAGGCMKPPSALVTAHKHRGSGGCPSGDEYVPLAKVDLIEPCDWGHSYKNVIVDYDNGLMDGFGLEGQGQVCKGKAGTHVYQYVDPQQIAPYWDIAEQWVLADHLFQTQGSGSFTGHQDLIAGATIINKAKTKSLIDFPSRRPWGCDAIPGTKTTVAFWNGTKVQDQYHRGPFPCMSYATLRDLLDAKGVTWKYYSPPEPNGTGALWNAFDAIDAVRNGPEWKTNIAKTNVFFTDVSGGTLPAVSWIVPDDNDSDHPATHDTGPSWVASIVNAVGQSDYWNTTAVIVVWDDWGGFYDHEPPPFFDHWGGLGFRVPMLIVSPYARMGVSSQPGYISHTPYEFGSILKFVENLYGLGTLGTTDKRSTSISDSFDFTQPARPFVVVPSKYSRDFFLREKPSYKPVDSE
jgi:phospholipase C